MIILIKPKTKQTNLQIVENGGWHFTNLKTAEEIHTKLSNFGHHNEFDGSGVTVKDIQECIDNRIVNYNHQADQSADNKYTANERYFIFIRSYVNSSRHCRLHPNCRNCG